MTPEIIAEIRHRMALTLVLDLILEVEGDIMDHVASHASHLHGVDEVQECCMEALKGDERHFLGMAHVEGFVVEGAYVIRCEGLGQRQLMPSRSLLNQVHGLPELPLLLAPAVQLVHAHLLRSGLGRLHYYCKA